jgi:hypothetical protein
MDIIGGSAWLSAAEYYGDLSSQRKTGTVQGLAARTFNA